MLWSSQAAAFYPTLCANDYVPDSYRLTGTVEARLWKCCFSRSSGLFFRQLQSVMIVTAWLICGLHCINHISDALITLHWLRAQETVLFKMAVLMYKASHGAIADLLRRRCLRSAQTNLLLMPSVKLSINNISSGRTLN